MLKQNILVIDDDVVDYKTISRALAQADWQGELSHVTDAAQAIERMKVQAFECILLDYHLPGMDGLDLLGIIHDELKLTAPVVMLTGEGSEVIAVEAMKRGAFDYLPKSLIAPDTLMRVIRQAIEKSLLQRQLAEAHAQLEHLALYDSLTNLGNRSLFMRDLTRNTAVAERGGRSFCVMVMDLDKFKAANDTYGHKAGDMVLCEVGRRLADMGRSGDFFYRLGGDEFTALIDAADFNMILPIALRIGAALAEPIIYESHSIQIGVSIGIAIYSKDGTTSDALLRAADNAMYQAKRSGEGIAFAQESQH